MCLTSLTSQSYLKFLGVFFVVLLLDLKMSQNVDNLIQANSTNVVLLYFISA